MTADKTTNAIYVRQYKLTISTDICSRATVSRTSSFYAGTGSLISGAKIYVGDVLSVTFAKDSNCTCFDLRVHSINGNNSYDAGTYTYTVSGDTTVVANSHLRQYTLTKRQATGTTVTVNRTASPNTAAGVVAYKVADGTTKTLSGKASTGNLGNNAAIYCGDVLDTNFKLKAGYSWGEYGHSERGWHFQGLGINEWGPNNDLNEEKN